MADPAVGTGTFLLGVLRRIAETVTADLGAGAVRGAIEAAAKRIIGFEIQFGPFAVAQLRLIAEMQTLMGKPPLPELRLFITDTLGNPFIEEEQLGQTYEPIAIHGALPTRSRRRSGSPSSSAIRRTKKRPRAAVAVRKDRRKARRAARSLATAAGMGRWRASQTSENFYVYFWRWATWKVFGSLGIIAATGNPDRDEEGIVCFITVAGFLNGPGFEKMRDDLRRTCSEIWVVDFHRKGTSRKSRPAFFRPSAAGLYHARGTQAWQS